MEHKSDYPRVSHLVDAGAKGHQVDAADAVELPFGRLLMVAEGMGSEEARNEPASIVLDALSRYLQEARVDANLPDAIRNHLKSALVAANRQLLGAGKVSRSLKDAAVSVVAVLVVGERAYIGCSGVARLYLVRDGKGTRVTRFDADEAGGMPPKPLGLDQTVEPLVMASSIAFQAGDALVLCTGGLYDVVNEDEIARETIAYPAEVSTIMLLEMARRRETTRTVAMVVYQSSAPHLKVAPSPTEKKAAPAVAKQSHKGRSTAAGWAVLALVALLVAGGVYGAVSLYRSWQSDPPEAVTEPAPPAAVPDVVVPEPRPEGVAPEKLARDPLGTTEALLKQEVIRREQARVATEQAREESVPPTVPPADPREAESAQTSKSFAAQQAAAEAAAAKQAAKEAAAAKQAAKEAAAAKQAAKEAAAAKQAAKEEAAAKQAAKEEAAAKQAAKEEAAAKQAAKEAAAAEQAALEKAAAQKAAMEKAGLDPLERCTDAGLAGDDRARVRAVRDKLDEGWQHLKRRKGSEAAQVWGKVKIKMKHGSDAVQGQCGAAVEAYRVALYGEYLRLARFFSERKRCPQALARAADSRLFGAPEEEIKATIPECYQPPK
jgi:hypothetical protein